MFFLLHLVTFIPARFAVFYFEAFIPRIPAERIFPFYAGKYRRFATV
jgi:hypothetical protein